MMMMLLILSLALTTLFYTLTQTISFARDSEARIKAVALAREGIEAVYNIRNTNWLRFSSDRKNCWDVLDYNPACVGGGGWVEEIENNTSYILTINNGLWWLTKKTTSWDNANFNANENKHYQIDIDSNGWYVAKNNTITNTCKNIAPGNTNCRSIFSRDIVISDKDTEKFIVTSTVHWYNSWPRKVSLQATVTNWKALYN